MRRGTEGLGGHGYYGASPLEPHKLALRGVPISDLPEAAGKGLKNPERQSADCRGLLGSTGRF